MQEGDDQSRGKPSVLRTGSATVPAGSVSSPRSTFVLGGYASAYGPPSPHSRHIASAKAAAILCSPLALGCVPS